MPFRNEKFSVSCFGKDCLRFNSNILKRQICAHPCQILSQIQLRLERDDTAMGAPLRKPVEEASLVCSDIANEISWPNVPEYGG